MRQIYLGQALKKHLEKEIDSHISYITCLLLTKYITKASNPHVSFSKLKALAKFSTLFKG